LRRGSNVKNHLKSLLKGQKWRFILPAAPVGCHGNGCYGNGYHGNGFHGYGIQVITLATGMVDVKEGQYPRRSEMEHIEQGKSQK
jgi:hypothetical protein